QKSPRIRYVLDIIGASFWQQKIGWTEQLSVFTQHPGPRIAYTQKAISSSSNHLWIPARSFLQEETIRVFEPKARTQRGQWQLFPSDHQEASFPFDILSAIFYLLSRYEEYLPFKSDSHQRFPATESILKKADRLKQPVVDEWIWDLTQVLQRQFPDWSYQAPRYSFLPSYDIDVAWAFKHRLWYRQVASAIKNMLRGDWFLEKLRWQTIFNRRSDPFFTFPKIRQIHQDHEQAILFFLLGEYGQFDKNIAPTVPAFQQLIQSIHGEFMLGLHPSYQSNEHPEQLTVEVRALSDILQVPVQDSRQHYLKLRFPQTYRRLIDRGIRVDYSMGFADDIGFRAGISRPFSWYDLKKETQTNLQIVPFMVMDVTLLQKGDPDRLKPEIFAMIQRTRAVGGQFCTLWHNNTLSDLPPFGPNWSALYQELVSEARRSS
ncbi:MAG: polysaccharide deacetylase family protein, partial [Bacteroidota bacterium]